VRRFLNLAGFRGGAYVVAYVEDTSEREITKRDAFGDEGSRYVNPQPRINLEIADCSNRIDLEFEVDSDLDVENSLHKVDALVDALTEFRSGLLEEARLCREREPQVEALNRKVSSLRRCGVRRRTNPCRPASSTPLSVGGGAGDGLRERVC
jgi:hypothetical protein